MKNCDAFIEPPLSTLWRYYFFMLQILNLCVFAWQRKTFFICPYTTKSFCLFSNIMFLRNPQIYRISDNIVPLWPLFCIFCEIDCLNFETFWSILRNLLQLCQISWKNCRPATPPFLALARNPPLLHLHSSLQSRICGTPDGASIINIKLLAR